MTYYGDFEVGSTVSFRFNTRSTSQTPITFAGSPAVAVYKDSVTESTSGVSLFVDYDSRTGLHYVVVDTSSNLVFYEVGKDYDIVVTSGTVDGISVVNEKLGTFSIENRCVAAVTGNVAGNVNGNVVGNVNGNVAGNLGGNVVGDVNGDVAGNVNGTVGDTRLDDIKKNTNLIPALL